VDPADIARSVAAYGETLAWAPPVRGHPCQQFAADLRRYAELIDELGPPWVLECGTADGGTALFLAGAMAAAGCAGPVYSIDNDPRTPGIDCPQLVLLKGDALDPGVIARMAARAAHLGGRGLVLLDDDHSSGHVLAELDAYGPLADYLIAEDTLMEYLPYADGPHVALGKWLPQHPEFTPDPEPVPSNHPGGWLRRTG
jgi:cephalosporin hydroxylase